MSEKRRIDKNRSKIRMTINRFLLKAAIVIAIISKTDVNVAQSIFLLAVVKSGPTLSFVEN
jgi:hypothetical protein